MTTLLNCFFGGRRQTSDLFEKLPTEIITIILNYVKPEYVFIEKYSTTKIKTLEQYEDIFKALVVVDTVCENSNEPNDLDKLGYVYRILTNKSFIISTKLHFFEFVGGENCKKENIRIAFEVLNIDINKSCFKIPKLKDLDWLSCYNYIHFCYRQY